MHDHDPGDRGGLPLPGEGTVPLSLDVLGRAFPHLVAVDLGTGTIRSLGPALLPLYEAFPLCEGAGPLGRPVEEVLDLPSPAGWHRDLSDPPAGTVGLRLRHPAAPALHGPLVVDADAGVVLFLATPVSDGAAPEGTAGAAPGDAPALSGDRLAVAQVRAQRFAEGELALAREIGSRHDHKLEALGRLSAGIAHEINTPIQFVGDNTRFLADAYSTMLELLLQYRRCLSGGPGALSWDERRDLMTRAEAAADIDYLAEEVPLAVEQSLEGIERVATLVRAMKAFSYKDNAEPGHADLNEALRSTLTVARNEIKYVADVVLDLDDIPTVLCHVGSLNQVFLNLLVNAADALQDRPTRGTITVTTRHRAGEVTVSVLDDGPGIPPDVLDKIFEPFFTTKDVGQGTGQGLALARAVVVQNHGGVLDVVSEPGVGTRFDVRLPVDGRAPSAA